MQFNLPRSILGDEEKQETVRKTSYIEVDGLQNGHREMSPIDQELQ